MLLNGNFYNLIEPISLPVLLRRLAYQPQLVAVELNGKIIKRADFAAVIVKADDKLEIVSFVGGG